MCKENSRLRKQFLSERANPLRQVLAQEQRIGTIQRGGLTRGEGDKRYVKPPDVTKIIDGHASTHDPVTLAPGHAAELTLAGQVLNLDLSNYAPSSSIITDHGALAGLGDDDHTQYVLRSILTTKGDIYGRSSSGVTRLGVGSNGQVLTADSGSATGLSWATPTTGAPVDAQYLTLANSGTLTAERVLTAGAGLTGTDAGANSTYTLALATPGTLTATTSNNSSGSHTHAITSSANPGATADVLIKTGAAGSVTLESLSINRGLVVNEGGGGLRHADGG